MAIQQGNTVCVMGCPKSTSKGLVFNFHVQQKKCYDNFFCDIHVYFIPNTFLDTLKEYTLEVVPFKKNLSQKKFLNSILIYFFPIFQVSKFQIAMK